MELSNKDKVRSTLKAQGAKVLVAFFPPESAGDGPAPGSAGWRRLGATNFYALPLDLTPGAQQQQQPHPWSMDNLARKLIGSRQEIK